MLPFGPLVAFDSIGGVLNNRADYIDGLVPSSGVDIAIEGGA